MEARPLAEWTAEILQLNQTPPEVIDRVLAALGQAVPEMSESSSANPSELFIQSLAVEGFRGIGDALGIALQPRPGLTIISGRNGSGKSSLAEGLEVALTGRTFRWRNAQFTSQWRNLHHPTPCRVELKLRSASADQTSVRIEWPDDEAAHDQMKVTYVGDAGESTAMPATWSRALEMYRPILSYEELGNILTGRPVDLAKRIFQILGLDGLDKAAKILASQLKEAQQPVTREKETRKALAAVLAETADPRARQVTELLPRTIRSKVDLAAIRQLAVSLEPVGDDEQKLAAICALDLASPESIHATAQRLRAAATRLDTLDDSDTALEATRTQLLEQALAYHAHHGATPCPVCSGSMLDDAWAERTSTTLESLRATQIERGTATAELEEALLQARRLVAEPPAVVRQDDVQLTTQDQVVALWDRWADAPQDAHQLVEHLEQHGAPLSAAVRSWQDEARETQQTLRGSWQPVTELVLAWLVDWQQAIQANQASAEAKEAQEAARYALDRGRVERLKPIEEQAAQIWNHLRQESNVSISSMALGAQKLTIEAEVDGEASGALSVMSQGELHALGLALFLPRASMPDSPFRFVVLDDPVQAMDPSKVQGLLDVLVELAATRQVVVLSHDDRLAQAARRMQNPPRILEVHRSPRSKVTVQNALDPARRLVDEALGWLATMACPTG